MRIVSTVPSQTELLHYLGLGEQVVGITAYCVHPKSWRSEKTIIGGTKNLNIELIKSLKADVIIGNHEENVKEQVEAFRKSTKVYISNIETVEDALQMIKEVGELTHTSKKAEKLILEIKALRAKLKEPKHKKKAAYFIWNEPYMMAGPNTFIGNMLSEVGFENVAPKNSQRYPKIDFSKINSLKADVLLLSSEPYSFTTKHLHELAEHNPNSYCKIVDGELFSWYGSRMLHTYRYLIRLQAEMELR